MPAIERFEDIEAWQEARILTQAAYAVSALGECAKGYRSRDQNQGSAASTLSDIAEGFDCRTDRGFIRFLGYARRSASELQSQLYFAFDQGHISREEFEQICPQATETRRPIDGFIRYLEGRSHT